MDAGATSGYVVAPPVPPPSNACRVGLTFRGLNGTRLDNDYLGQDDLDVDKDWNVKPSRQNYFKGPAHIFSPNKDLNLHFGCNHSGAICHEADWRKAEGKWVFVSSPAGPFSTDFDVQLVATCVAGCPQDATGAGPWWLQGQVYETVWEFTGKSGQPSVVAATADCCKRKPQQCDALHANPDDCKAHCSKHRGPLGALNPICLADPCCEFVPNNPDFPFGDCVCKHQAPPTVCDHSAHDIVI